MEGNQILTGVRAARTSYPLAEYFVEEDILRINLPESSSREHLPEIAVGEPVAPDDVDIVINTHLHADHCAGNTRLIDEEAQPAFPRAEYWVQRMEWAEASHPDARTRGTYFEQNFSPLLAQGRLKLLHGDTKVTDGVHCVVTPGHTRGHQSVLLQDGDWRGLFVADMASYGIQMARTSWLTAYDVYPLENIRTKQRWQRWVLEKEAWIFFQHDPHITIARLVEEDGRKRLTPIYLD